MYASGYINGWTAAKGEIWTGSAGREVYTVARMIQDLVNGKMANGINSENTGTYNLARKILDVNHLIAISIGWITSAGTLAYPVECAIKPSNRNHALAQFILYDTITRIGELIPVIGGRDTRTEHFFNRIPNYVLRLKDAS